MTASVRHEREARPGRRKRRAALAACVLLAAWPPVAWAAARSLVETASLKRADALVVLSGSAAYVERTRRAAELFREGRAPVVVLTDDGLRGSWSEARQLNPLFVERARAELLGAGVPAERVVVLPRRVTSTHEEAAAAREFAEGRGLRSLLFVTSEYHTRRALWTLRRTFRESNVEIGVEAAATARDTPLTWWWHASGWRAVAAEYPKLAYYYWRYR